VTDRWPAPLPPPLPARRPLTLAPHPPPGPARPPGLSREAVADRVFRSGLRPRFPSAAPPAFVQACEACWQTDPGQRPSFSEITARLEAFASAMASGEAAPPAPLPALAPRDLAAAVAAL
jgi:hypothetical protein